MAAMPITISSTRPRFTVVALVLGALLLSGCSQVGTQATATPSATATTLPTAIETPSPVASPMLGRCNPGYLLARITMWDAGAGHRIANVEMSNGGAVACTVDALLEPQLVDGAGFVLIDSAPPAPSAALTMAPGDVLKTLVQDGNYCGPAPLAPVTVAFVFVVPGGPVRLVAAPTSLTDTTGVPPCLGDPGSAGDIEMHPWAP